MATMRITDSGGVHNSHGPNGNWLEAGYTYVCQTVDKQQRFVLKYRECTDAGGDHIWLCDPDNGSSVIALLPHALEQPLSMENFVEIEIKILRRRPPD